MSDILANIEMIFIDIPPKHYKVPITLSMDEVASDGRPCYLPETDELAGLYEHAASEVPSVTMGKDLNCFTAVHCYASSSWWQGPHRKGDLCGRICQESRNWLRCKASIVNAFMQERLLSRRNIHYGDTPSSIEDLIIWWISSWSTIVNGRGPKRRPALYLHYMVRDLMPADPTDSCLD